MFSCEYHEIFKGLNFIKKRPQQMFSCEYREMFKNTYFERLNICERLLLYLSCLIYYRFPNSLLQIQLNLHVPRILEIGLTHFFPMFLFVWSPWDQKEKLGRNGLNNVKIWKTNWRVSINVVSQLFPLKFVKNKNFRLKRLS